MSEENICGDLNANCNNVDGTYECACKDGFTGDVGACADINECDWEPVFVLCGDDNAVCTNTDGAYECSCQAGYSGNTVAGCTTCCAECNTTCADVNECTDETADCPDLSTCENNDGGYQCLCDLGYEMNADSDACIDVNECDQERDCI